MNEEYRNEIDSIHDKKFIISKVIKSLIEEGIPTEVIFKHSYFVPFKNSDLMDNLIVKTEEPSEEKNDKFLEKDEITKEISKRKQKILSENDQKLYDNMHKVIELQTANKELSEIINLVDDLENEEEINQDKLISLLNKHGFEIKDYSKIIDIYKIYTDLQEEKSNLLDEKSNLERNKSKDEELLNLYDKESELTMEIFQENYNLISLYISNKCKNIPAENEDLYQELEKTLYESINSYDVSKGSFSSWVELLFDGSIKRNFKDLTGYDYNYYWNKKIVNDSIDEVEKIIGRRPTLEELEKIGLFNKDYINLVDDLDIKMNSLEFYSDKIDYTNEDDEEVILNGSKL